MEKLTYENILEYLEQRPEETAGNSFEEIPGGRVPKSWTLLGTLTDEQLRPASVLYKPWTHYAIGFYPYSDCEIYEDAQKRILLSYLEYGGHTPFRRSFIATKNSPFIPEPVGFKLEVAAADHQRLLELLAAGGLTAGKMETDEKHFQKISQVTEDLDPESIYLYRRHFSAVSNSYDYTLIAKRQLAHAMTATVSEWHYRKA